MVAIKTLKEKFFSLAPLEDYPKTPDITNDLDELQEEIRNLMSKR